VDDFNEITNHRPREKDHVLEILNEFGEKVFIVFNVKEQFEYDQTELSYSKIVRNGDLIDNRNNDSGVSNPNYYYFLSKALKACVRNGYL
jgi:hypothetical protein